MAYNNNMNPGNQVPGQPQRKRRNIRPNRPYANQGVPNQMTPRGIPQPGPNAPMRPGQVPNQMTPGGIPQPGPNANINPGMRPIPQQGPGRIPQPGPNAYTGNVGPQNVGPQNLQPQPPSPGQWAGQIGRVPRNNPGIENRGGSRVMSRPGMGNVMRNRRRRG